MDTKKNTTFVLNTAFVRKDGQVEGIKTAAYTGSPDNQGEAVLVTRVDNFYLSDEQIATLREIHERAESEIRDALGW